jgi:hypothetical protein
VSGAAEKEEAGAGPVGSSAPAPVPHSPAPLSKVRGIGPTKGLARAA